MQNIHAEVGLVVVVVGTVGPDSLAAAIAGFAACYVEQLQ